MTDTAGALGGAGGNDLMAVYQSGRHAPIGGSCKAQGLQPLGLRVLNPILSLQGARPRTPAAPPHARPGCGRPAARRAPLPAPAARARGASPGSAASPPAAPPPGAAPAPGP